MQFCIGAATGVAVVHALKNGAAVCNMQPSGKPTLVAIFGTVVVATGIIDHSVAACDELLCYH
jgi:hypothetical protein